MEIAIAAENIGHLGALPVTNTLLVTWVASLILVVIALVINRNVKMVPSGMQNVLEFVVEYAYNLTEELAHSKTKTFFPFIGLSGAILISAKAKIGNL